jgi:hypothetical protein
MTFRWASAIVVGSMVCAVGCDKKDEASAAPPGTSQAVAPASSEHAEQEHRDRPHEEQHDADGGREHGHEHEAK